MILNAGGSFMDAAQVASSWNAGALLNASGKEVLIKATAKLVITCGSSSIVILPDQIVISGAELDMADGKRIQAVAPKILHN
jgi:hypothetical protein